MHDVFLRKICEQPGDDLPRLIYADWLEEQGDPRAEFIRVQIRLWREKLWFRERRRLEQREAGLLTAHRAAWAAFIKERWELLLAAAGCQSRWYPSQHELHYRRGFPHGVCLQAEQFGRDFPLIRRLIPVECVSLVLYCARFHGTEWEEMEQALHQYELGQLSIHLWDNEPAELERFAASGLGRLQQLELIVSCHWLTWRRWKRITDPNPKIILRRLGWEDYSAWLKPQPVTHGGHGGGRLRRLRGDGGH